MFGINPMNLTWTCQSHVIFWCMERDKKGI